MRGYDVDVVLNDSIAKHGFFMILFLMVFCPIEYYLYISHRYSKTTDHKKRWDLIANVINTLFLIIFCLEATYNSKPAYLNYIKTQHQEEINDDPPNTNTKFEIRNKQTFHSKMVPFIIVLQCVQLISLVFNTDNYYLKKFLHVCKILLLVIILPLQVLSGIITIDFGTLVNNDHLDFLQEVPRDTQAHLFLPLPFYILGIYYIWNHNYININSIEKRLQWFNNTFLIESCLSMIFSFISIMYYSKNESIFDIFYLNIYPNEWTNTKWHVVMLGIPYFIASILSLIIRGIYSHNGINTVNSRTGININKKEHSAKNVNVSMLNIHNLLISSATLLYGYNIINTSEKRHESQQEIYKLSGYFAIMFGIIKVLFTLPITLANYSFDKRINKNTNANANAIIQICNIIEQLIIIIATLFSLMHFFSLCCANPILTKSWYLQLGFPLISYDMIVFAISISVWGIHLILSKTMFDCLRSFQT